MAVITIRGHLGSEAYDIGHEIAERLNIDYVDRKIIEEVAVRVNRQEQEIEAKELPPATFLERIMEAMSNNYTFATGYAGTYLPTWEIPLDNISYFKALESVIKELAKKESIVIRGRGSQFILKDYPHSFHVLIVAPLELRIPRVMKRLKLNEEHARKEIIKFDKSRHEFNMRYFKADLDDPVYYDIVINTQYYSVEDATSIIVDALSIKEKALGESTPDSKI